MTQIWINFLIESGISLSVLGGIYYLFLRKETFFLQNRIFLFVSVVFSVFLPLLRFRVYEPMVTLPEITVTPTQSFLYEITSYSQGVSKELEQTISSLEILMWLYLAGVVFFSCRFLAKCVQIYHLRKQSKKHEVSGTTVCVTSKDIAPFSFLNTVFVPQNLEKQDGYQQILLHEMEHVKQRHSYDILIIELLLVVQWSNPFVWLLKRAIHENHEFLADKAVLAHGTKRGYYKLLLLNECLGETLFIGSPFNYSLIKNRIKMMNKLQSKKIANMKYLLGLLVAVGLITGFALENKLTAETKIIPQKTKEARVEVIMQGEIVKIVGKRKEITQALKLISRNIGNNAVLDMHCGDNELCEMTLYPKGSSKEIIRRKGNYKPDKNNIFVRAEQMPKFPGGITELPHFIEKNVKYPKEAADKGIQGRVYLKFVIEKDGSVGKVQVLRSPHKLLSNEAIRVVKMLPKFEPAKQKRKTVRCWYQLPVTFKMDNPKEEETKK